MLKIAFLDQNGADYRADTPGTASLGGSQSAMCYLALGLARMGHEVVMVTGTSNPGDVNGVDCQNDDVANWDQFQDFDCLIFLNGVASHPKHDIRRWIGPRPKLVLWTQHADDQGAVAELAEPDFRDAWDAVVLISRWQAHRMVARFDLNPTRIHLLCNAVGGRFVDMFSATDDIFAQKPWPPVLAYTSTPFRGLDVLLDAFPTIREAIPGTTLNVFSSLQVYRAGDDAELPFEELYQTCRDTDGISYRGSVSQTELAASLMNTTCLAYPNTFAETSCIAVMEAMAAGCLVVTSDLGALPETTAGYARLTEVPADLGMHSQLFALAVVEELRRLHDDPAARTRLGQQVGHVNAQMTWTARAIEWNRWLSVFINSNT